jgi:hypothetical protein
MAGSGRVGLAGGLVGQVSGNGNRNYVKSMTIVINFVQK